MTLVQLFGLGFIAGITIGGPYGPSGILSLYRSVQYGWRVGFLTAAGSLAAIFLFSFLAAFFVEAMAPVLQNEAIVSRIRLFMGVSLLLIGLLLIYTARTSTSSAKPVEKTNQLSDFKMFMSAFGIGILSGKNVIGFPSFLIATPFTAPTENPILLNALSFSLGSILSSAVLYALLIAFSAKYGALIFARIIPFLKYFLALFFVGIGVYLILQYLSS